jgi:hypothetical protein
MTGDPGVDKTLSFVASILIPDEKLEACAVQRRFFALTHRRLFVFATSGRFIALTRGLFGGYTPQDVRWQDVKEARIRVGIFGAELTIQALPAPDLASNAGARYIVIGGLRKAEAQAVYRICQAQEQAWREKRRLRELEELRAKSGGFQLGGQASPPSLPGQSEPDPTTRLQRARDMLDKGLISDSEYETIKARIVGNL